MNYTNKSFKTGITKMVALLTASTTTTTTLYMFCFMFFKPRVQQNSNAIQSLIKEIKKLLAISSRKIKLQKFYTVISFIVAIISLAFNVYSIL